MALDDYGAQGTAGTAPWGAPALTLIPRLFFDACDGLFVNYNWKEEHLERTRELAGQRHADVYIGVDVFARGDVVGGGFDTNKVCVLEAGLCVCPWCVALSSLQWFIHTVLG